MSDAEDECCEASFHCPECEGHHFGAVLLDKPKNEWVVHCHNEYGPCGWSGPYDEHVKPLNYTYNGET